ncbi:MAG: ABC transporter ATP-binding protein [Betaproteobacteria bacterium]
MLSIEGLSIAYGGIRAVREATLTVEDAAVTCLIGRNGSGKSSLVMAVAGLVSASGSTRLDGIDISRKSPASRARLGISLVPESRRIFGSLTARENLLLGAPRDARVVATRLASVLDLFPALADLLDRGGHEISGGQQQMLAIGRALMCGPRVLILDEPSLGLAPIVVIEVFRAIARIAAAGQSVLLIEQNAKAALDVATYAYAMSLGKVESLGATADLPSDFELRDLYL